ncbi:MAG TPA: class I SAM-dependent methyltransferase family protein [Thermoproteota archaeon]|nr:class I SAM-dependent methyltransferase family protein [Thermoproteota archaeon]
MRDKVRTAIAVKVPLEKGERVRMLLKDLGAINPDLAPAVEGGYLLLPVLDRRKLEENTTLNSLELAERELKVNERRPRSVKDALLRSLQPDWVNRITRSFDIIGDVAVISAQEGTSRYRENLVSALLSVHPRVRLILAKISPISGVGRIASYERWYGSGTTETLHREHGCVYSLDVTKVFFTPRLSTERQRVASLVRPGEIVCDLFAGVGPFSVLIAKLQPSSHVKAVDISPEAVTYLKRNVRINGVSDRVEIFQGDAAEVSHRFLRGSCDRVVMNLPKEAELYLAAATDALKNQGGMIHLYSFRRASQTFEEKISHTMAELESLGWKNAKVSFHRIVREIGPREFNEVVDIRVS